MERYESCIDSRILDLYKYGHRIDKGLIKMKERLSFNYSKIVLSLKSIKLLVY